MLKNFEIDPAELAEVKVTSNFHTHNFLCGHAGGTVCDYAAEAVGNGLSIIGISDHFSSPLGTFEPYLTFETIDTEYLPQFAEAREKFGGKIKILSAVEIEYFYGQGDFYNRLSDKLDYLVLGQHEFMCDGDVKNSFCDGVGERNILAYIENVRRAIDSGYFSVLAHPDLIFYRRPTLTRAVECAFDGMIRAAAHSGIAVELNANGIRSHNFRYPTDLLVESCEKHGANVVVSSDAHSPDVLCDEYVKSLYVYAQKCGLKIVNAIELH